jgi:hypothetical protein
VAALDPDLSQAINPAVLLDRHAPAVFAGRYSWEAAADAFLLALRSAAAVREPRSLLEAS